MTEKDLFDVWCRLNAEQCYYTLEKKQRKNSTLQCLDFILASNNILSKIKKIEIGSRTNISDHRPLTFSVASNSLTTGPGFWRFNNNLLSETETHLDTINIEIDDIMKLPTLLKLILFPSFFLKFSCGCLPLISISGIVLDWTTFRLGSASPPTSHLGCGKTPAPTCLH